MRLFDEESGESVSAELAVRKASIDAFHHPVEVMEPLEVDDATFLIRRLADVLAPILGFVARGRLTGTMDVRAWVVLYETRPDLLKGETIGEFATRRDLTPTRVHELITQFREMVPAFRSERRRSEVHVQHMREAQLARHAAAATAVAPSISCGP